MTRHFTKKVWTKDPAAHMPFIYCVGPNDINWRRGDAMLVGADYQTGGPMFLHFERRPRGGFIWTTLTYNSKNLDEPPKVETHQPHLVVPSWREIIKQIENAKPRRESAR